MDDFQQVVVTAVVTVVTCSGFWEFMRRRTERRDLKTQMLIGLGHDRIISLCCQYIRRKSITQAEYENLNDYLYKPYLAMGGNGSAKRLMEEVNKLPIVEATDLNSKEVC